MHGCGVREEGLRGGKRNAGGRLALPQSSTEENERSQNYKNSFSYGLTNYLDSLEILSCVVFSILHTPPLHEPWLGSL